MTEEFLYYIWRKKLFKANLRSTSGDLITVISTGERNTNAGPDFINAKIRIADTLWAGNIEIHVNTSDWIKHGHQYDNSYKNVILHVVYSDDLKVEQKIPLLELKGNFDERIMDNYNNLLTNKEIIACRDSIKDADSLTINSWLAYLLVERLERKTALIKNVLEKNKNDWEKTFYRFLASNFGFKINSFAFDLMAENTAFEYIVKQRDNLFQIEALLFGQAGLLNSDFKDDYPLSLKKEYKYLKHKFRLTPVEPHHWKLLRLRPANFPYIRIAQFSSLLHKHDGIFARINEAKSIHQLKEIFKVKTSDYWNKHYVFDKNESKNRKTELGENSIENIIINTIVPFMFLYGSKKDNEEYKSKALCFLEKIKPENNSIIRLWKEVGIKATNAFESQSLIELKNEYCNLKKCMSCRICHKILEKTF